MKEALLKYCLASQGLGMPGSQVYHCIPFILIP